MSITPIRDPLPGERVLAISPGDASEAAVTWLRRPNFFPGRALTAPTLESRALWLTGRIAQRGQAFTPGVVSGFEVELRQEPGDGDDQAAVTLRIDAGRGLSVGGEDVVLTRAAEADLWSLPVVAPPAFFEGEGFGGGGVLQPREVGSALGAVVQAHAARLPRAAVLVLQPAATRRFGVDPEDPCERGCGDGGVSYDDQRLADAARLLWYAWPEDWRPLPPGDERLRNRLAHIVFDAEAGLSAGECLPWEVYGVPVALVGLTEELVPAFTDRASVVRRGGLARDPRLTLGAGEEEGATLMARHRLAGLWQARIEQFAEQVAGAGTDASDPAQLASRFDRLPPFGLLPRSAVDLEASTAGFFPATFELDAVPIPVEQLDLAVEDAAALAPIDLSRGERVRILVPVAQSVYEPRLLLREEVDPEFESTLQRFLLARARALAGRQSVRLRSAVLLRALRGAAPAVPAIEEDPRAVEPESTAPWGPPPGEAGHRSSLRAGVHEHGFAGASTPLVSGAGQALFVWVNIDPEHPPRTLMIEWASARATRRAYWGENLIDRGTDGRVTRVAMGELPPADRWVRLEVPAAQLELENTPLVGMSFVLFDGRAAYGATGSSGDGQDSTWGVGALPSGAETTGNEPFEALAGVELLGPFEPRAGVVATVNADRVPTLGSAGLSALAADSRLTALLSARERARLPELGVERFAAYLKARADRADDLVDYGFLKVQTDIYRVRQLVLGTTDATRLAVSPALANIARADTAVATQENISTLFERLRSSPAPESGAVVASAPAGSGGTTTRPSGAGGAVGSVANVGAFRAEAFRVTRPSNVPLASTVIAEAVREQPAASRIGTAEMVRAESSIRPLAAARTYSPVEVKQAEPLIGNFEIRTISIAERIQAPKAQEARDYSTSTRHEAVLGLVRLADDLTEADGAVPGLFEGIDVWGVEGDEFVPGGNDPVAAVRRPLADFLNPTSRPTLMAALLRPPARQGADEATYFSDTADLADRTVALLRQVEGRVHRYRQAIAACEEAAAAIRGDVGVLAERERAWEDTLAEARHDVGVARALIAEEQARLDGINARRAEVLEREVRFVAFMRPRSADVLLGAPSRPLDPGLLEAPVPACMSGSGDAPEEVLGVLRVVREAPAGWFRVQRGLLDGLNRVDMLLRAIDTSQLRAQLQPARLTAPQIGVLAAGGGGSQILQSVVTRQERQLDSIRSVRAPVDVSRLSGLTWQGVRVEAARVVSLGALAEGGHGSPAVARSAAAFLERFARVCGCLHAGFSGVAPSIRLTWTEILSQFDEPPMLRSLASLPRWSELPYADRRSMQAMADWLYDQVDAEEPRAVGLIGDVVRMTLLLASHAPVGRIITGRLPRPVLARPGLRIPLVPTEGVRLKVGMEAVVYRADRIVARALVEDVGGSEVAARVLHTSGTEVQLDPGMRVQFAAPSALHLPVGAGAPLRTS